MQPDPGERDPYNGLTQAEPTLPSSAYWDADAYQRDLDAIWYRRLAAGLPRGRPRPAAGLPDIPHRHAGNRRAARRHRRAARLPQHLPASRLAALPGERGPAEGAADHLPLPCLVLFAARRSRARAVEIAAGRFRQGRSSALPRWRCRCGAASSSSILQEDAAGSARNILRSRIRRPRQLAAGNAGHRPCAAQGDELQLEDLLGKLQRVPALPGRPQGSVAAGADLWPRPDGAARRSRLGPPCRQ